MLGLLSALLHPSANTLSFDLGLLRLSAGLLSQFVLSYLNFLINQHSFIIKFLVLFLSPGDTRRSLSRGRGETVSKASRPLRLGDLAANSRLDDFCVWGYLGIEDGKSADRSLDLYFVIIIAKI